MYDQAMNVAITLAKPFEGWSSKVYKCPGGYWTIAYGHRCNKNHPNITREQGERYLQMDMNKAMIGAIKYCPVLVMHPKKFGAIADFCFNLGVGRLQTSTLKRKINAQDWTGAIKELNRWVYGGGRKLKGLVRRRAAEAQFLRSTEDTLRATERSCNGRQTAGEENAREQGEA